MGRNFCIVLCLIGMMVGLTVSITAQEASSQANASKATTSAQVHSNGATSDRSNGAAKSAGGPSTDVKASAEERALRLEGEKRFRANCGRCHLSPHKFPPRVIATAIRHMRVRATITDEDMRLILKYMTE